MADVNPYLSRSVGSVYKRHKCWQFPLEFGPLWIQEKGFIQKYQAVAALAIRCCWELCGTNVPSRFAGGRLMVLRRLCRQHHQESSANPSFFWDPKKKKQADLFWSFFLLMDSPAGLLTLCWKTWEFPFPFPFPFIWLGQCTSINPPLNKTSNTMPELAYLLNFICCPKAGINLAIS